MMRRIRRAGHIIESHPWNVVGGGQHAATYMVDSQVPTPQPGDMFPIFAYGDGQFAQGPAPSGPSQPYYPAQGESQEMYIDSECSTETDEADMMLTTNEDLDPGWIVWTRGPEHLAAEEAHYHYIKWKRRWRKLTGRPPRRFRRFVKRYGQRGRIFLTNEQNEPSAVQ